MPFVSDRREYVDGRAFFAPRPGRSTVPRMAQATWTLVPKIKAEHAEDHDRFIAERDEKQQELKGIGLVSRLLPGPAKRRAKLKAEVATLGKRIAACYGPVGYDLKPPRIGIDDKATKWYRKHLSQDPEAWPLPPDEMVEEMKGQPVWHLSEHQPVQHLDVGWPKQGFPIPTAPGLTMPLIRKLTNHLDPEQAVAAGHEVQDAVLAYFRNKYESLADGDFNLIVNSMVKGALPGGPKGSIDAADQEAAHQALSAAQWLVFWGSKGYSLKCDEPMG